MGRPRTLPIRRWLAKVSIGEECWEWMGQVARNGYGRFRSDPTRPSDGAHRFAYEFFVGPIPDGLPLDHLCRNRRCVRPDHLEQVTTRENILRGESVAALNARKDRCQRGHEFDYVDARGKRICRTCKREWYLRHTKSEVL